MSEARAYAGTSPMTLLQPKRMPRKLQSARSRRYARLLTLVKIFPSCSEMPGGRAFLRFLNLPVGLPSSRVAGTCSK